MLDALLNSFKDLDINKLRPDGFYRNFLSAKEKDVDRINKGSGWELLELCPICGSNIQITEFDCIGIRVVKCPDCTHRYTDRIPVNLDEVYDSVEYEEALKILELQQQDYRANRFGKERSQIAIDLFDNNIKAVLDVGCGWGYFLSHLKEAGFDSYGIELSRPVAELARKQYNLNISSTPIEKYEPEMQFDLITLFGVIEHVKEPDNFMKHCKRLLKEGGYLLIFTPNFESVAVNVMRECSNMVYPGQHLHHFTLASMKKMSDLIQMSVHSLCTKGIDIGDICGYMKFLGQDDLVSFLQENANLLQSVIDEASCGNHMRVIFEK